jgi:cytochrome b
MQGDGERVRVWDPLVRIGHWTLAAAFLIAYFTAEELEGVHVAAGYWVGGYVIVRTAWGFVGSPHARFSDFVRGPKAVLAYFLALLRGRAPRYLGHNPAGGAMIVALLIGLAGTVFTGLAVEADAENEGPLAPWLGHPVATAVQAESPVMTSSRAGETDAADEAGESGEGGENRAAHDRESRYEEVHELFANLTLALVVLHILGVIADIRIHRENIVRAMVTGYKSRYGANPNPSSGSTSGRNAGTPRSSR